MRIRGLCKLPCTLGLALVGRAMPSKSLIKLSADEWGCVSSLYFAVGVMEIFSISTYSSTLCLRGLLLPMTLTRQQATVNPCLCRRLPNTHRQVWFNLLWGHCSFLLSPGVHKPSFVPSKSQLKAKEKRYDIPILMQSSKDSKER